MMFDIEVSRDECSTAAETAVFVVAVATAVYLLEHAPHVLVTAAGWGLVALVSGIALGYGIGRGWQLARP